MKLLYRFLILFLLFSFNNTNAKAKEVEIEALVKYIASAEKCEASIPSISNFKIVRESGAWEKIGKAILNVRLERNYQLSSGLYDTSSIINFYKQIEYATIKTESCAKGLNEFYNEVIKN